MNNYNDFIKYVLENSDWENDHSLRKQVNVVRIKHYLKKLIHIDLYFQDDIIIDWGTENKNQIKSLMLWDEGVRNTLYIFSFMDDHVHYDKVDNEYPYNTDFAL